MATTYWTDTANAKLDAEFARVAFTYDWLVLDWWPTVGSGEMPAIGSVAMDDIITAELTGGAQTPSADPFTRWAQYWEWVTL